MSELKSCPFCGGTPRTITDTDLGKYPSSIVECSECRCSTNKIVENHEYLQISRSEAAKKAKFKAIAAWNKRIYPHECENCGKDLCVECDHMLEGCGGESL